MIFLGCDPGLHGSIAAVGEGIAAAIPFTSHEGTLDFVKIAAFVDSFKQFKRRAFVEMVHAMPKQGVSSSFSFGRTTGHIEGFLLGRGIHVTRVLPRKWMETMYIGVPQELQNKARSIYAASKLFPSISLLETPRCKTPHSGMADALLIAEFASRSLGAT